MKLAVGDGSLAAIFAEPDEGGAIAAVGFSMAVERVDGDVGPGAGEPLVMYSVPLQHTIPFARPRKSGCVLSPETLGILPGAVALCQPVFLDGITGHNLRGRVFLIHDQQVGDVLGLRGGEGAHANLRVEVVPTGRVDSAATPVIRRQGRR